MFKAEIPGVPSQGQRLYGFYLAAITRYVSIAKGVLNGDENRLTHRWESFDSVGQSEVSVSGRSVALTAAASCDAN
ncbi:hypothetical protein [Streptomyces sp. NBC_00829]|uniref:hypothetical protein n=1 Tax=Streptomyces sp. NBC_00829 TaxID=2903679 RepID=UPI00386E187A|nr:hypothetical protein OG293_11075 [Streptomyces sp. NBC_00829]